MRWVIVVAGLLLFTASATDALACSCSGFEFDPQSWDQNTVREREEARAEFGASIVSDDSEQVLFAGKVIAVETWSYPMVIEATDALKGRDEIYQRSMHWYVFDVKRSWKAVRTDKVAVYSSSSAASCGAYFGVGDELLVLGSVGAPNYYKDEQDLSGLFGTTSCSGSRGYEQADLDALDKWFGPIELELEHVSRDDPRLRAPVVPMPMVKVALSKWRWHRWLLLGAAPLLLLGILAWRRRTSLAPRVGR